MNEISVEKMMKNFQLVKDKMNRRRKKSNWQSWNAEML